MEELKEVKAPSIWRHHSGRLHRVVMLTNTDSKYPERYPAQVVLLGMNGQQWSRSISDWHRSFTWIKDIPPARSIESIVVELVACKDHLVVTKTLLAESKAKLAEDKIEIAELQTELTTRSTHDDVLYHKCQDLEQEVHRLRQVLSTRP